MTDTVDTYTPQTDTASLGLDGITSFFATLSEEARDALAAISDMYGVATSSGITLTEYVPGQNLSFQSAPLLPGLTSRSLSVGGPEFLGEVPAIPDVDISIESMPERSFSKPGITIPELPDIDWPAFSDSPPEPSPLSIPAAPAVSLDDPPSLEDIVIPAPPAVSVPEFEGVAPSIDLTPPDNHFAWSESAYTTALLAAIKSRLETNLHNLGTGVGATVEQQMYDREDARHIQEDEKAYLSALEDGCDRGFMLPPGETAGNVVYLSAAINRRREEENQKILAEQTELAQANTHAAMEAAIKVESLLLQHHNQTQARSFDVAQQAINAALTIYGLKIDTYRAKAKVFSTLANVYEARIRAEIVKAEIYKTHLEGIKAGAEVDQLKIERYKAQLRKISGLMEMYKTEMSAAHVLADVERNQITRYMGQIEVYRSRVEAIRSQYDGYIAQVRGETSKAELVKADSQAYRAEVKAYRTQAEAELETARAAIDAMRAKLAIYSAQVGKYDLDIDYEIGSGQVEERFDQALAELEVIRARYDGAAKELEARLYDARITEQVGQHRAKALAAEAEKDAAVTATEAAAQGERAANEAATSIEVATNAASTTSSSKNHRQSAAEETSERDSRNSSSTFARSNTYGEYTHIYHD